MRTNKSFDVIIIGGSYSGLAAAMALGRALRSVLIIDGNRPCNRQTPQSHNFITHDGKSPADISRTAREQVKNYATVEFLEGLATNGFKTARGFAIQTESGERFDGGKVIFATGIKDIMPPIDGFKDCWGISVIHCPFCHGYEVRNEATGILGNGEYAFEFSSLIANWTSDLTLFTNGPSTMTTEQTKKIEEHGIRIVEKEIKHLQHSEGYLQNVVFKEGPSMPLHAIYARPPFEQHCSIPSSLGCETENGYLKTDSSQRTTVPGVFACGDNSNRIRTLANAVSTGTTAGMMVNKEITVERF